MAKIILTVCPVCGATNTEALPTLTDMILKTMDPEVQNRIPPDTQKVSYYRRFTVTPPPDVMQLPLTDESIDEYELHDYVQQCNDGSYLYAAQTDTEPSHKVETYCCCKCHQILPPVLLRKKHVRLKRVLLIGPTSAGKTTTMATLSGIAGRLKAGDRTSYEYRYYEMQYQREKEGLAPLATPHGLETGIINRQPLLYLYHEGLNVLYTIIDTPGEVMEQCVPVWAGTGCTGLFLLNCDENRDDFESDYAKLKEYAEMYRDSFSKCVLNFTQCDVMDSGELQQMMLTDRACRSVDSIEQDDLAVAREQAVKSKMEGRYMQTHHRKLVRAASEFRHLFRDARFSVVFSAALGVPVIDEKLQGDFHPRYMHALLHAIL